MNGMDSRWKDYVSLSAFESDDKEEMFSDHGEGVERMIDEIDGRFTTDYYRRRANAAIKFASRNAPQIVPTLRLILKNGSNRRESIWSLMKNRQRGKLPKEGTTNAAI